MNRKQILELTNKNIKNMGRGYRNFRIPYKQRELVKCCFCQNMVMEFDARMFWNGDWICERCMERAK